MFLQVCPSFAFLILDIRQLDKYLNICNIFTQWQFIQQEANIDKTYVPGKIRNTWNGQKTEANPQKSSGNHSTEMQYVVLTLFYWYSFSITSYKHHLCMLRASNPIVNDSFKSEKETYCQLLSQKIETECTQKISKLKLVPNMTQKTFHCWILPYVEYHHSYDCISSMVVNLFISEECL